MRHHAAAGSPRIRSPGSDGLSSLFSRRKSSLRRCLRPGNFRGCIAVGTKYLVGLFLWPCRSAKVGIDVLPDYSAFGGDLEEPAEPALVNQRVAVWQALSVRYSRAVVCRWSKQSEPRKGA